MRGKQFIHAFFVGMKRLQNAQPHGFTVRSQRGLGTFPQQAAPGDTPMWNSTLSRKVGPIINPNPSAVPLAYRSPVEAERHDGLPPAYVEVAEFDCLHDDGVLYAQLLRDAGIKVEFHDGRIHAQRASDQSDQDERIPWRRVSGF